MSLVSEDAVLVPHDYTVLCSCSLCVHYRTSWPVNGFRFEFRRMPNEHDELSQLDLIGQEYRKPGWPVVRNSAMPRKRILSLGDTVKFDYRGHYRSGSHVTTDLRQQATLTPRWTK